METATVVMVYETWLSFGYRYESSSGSITRLTFEHNYGFNLEVSNGVWVVNCTEQTAYGPTPSDIYVFPLRFFDLYAVNGLF